MKIQAGTRLQASTRLKIESAKPVDTVDDELVEDDLLPLTDALNKSIKDFQKKLTHVPQLTSILQLQKQWRTIYKATQTNLDTKKAQKILQQTQSFLDAVLRASPEAKNKDSKLQKSSDSLLNVSKKATNHWSAEFDPFLVFDILDWLRLAAAYQKGNADLISRYALVDNTWQH